MRANPHDTIVAPSMTILEIRLECPTSTVSVIQAQRKLPACVLIISQPKRLCVHIMLEDPTTLILIIAVKMGAQGRPKDKC